MKELLKEWKQYSEYHELFERQEYIEYALGIKPLLNENGGSYYTSDMKDRIIEEHMLFEGFFDRFNPIAAIKKYGEEVGSLFTTLYDVIKNPKYIPDYVKAAEEKILRVWKQKIQNVQQFLVDKNMPTFAQGLQKAIDVISSVNKMPVDWKKAISITGVVIGIAYLFEKLSDAGADIFGEVKLDSLSDQVISAAQNFLMKEFPVQIAKLYGKAALAASTGFAGFVAVAIGFIKVVNLAKDALKPLFAKFKLLSKRRDDREKTAQDGILRLENKD